MTHPLSDFRYCPHCGSARFDENDVFSKRCADCGFTFYPNAAAATVAVITNARGELLCVRRDREPARGTLDLPGGFVDPGESITDGLLREVREEVGGELERFDFLFSLPNVYLFSGHRVHTSDAAELMWLPLSDVHPADFGLDSVRLGVETLLKMGK